MKRYFINGQLTAHFLYNNTEEEKVLCINEVVEMTDEQVMDFRRFMWENFGSFRHKTQLYNHKSPKVYYDVFLHQFNQV